MSIEQTNEYWVDIPNYKAQASSLGRIKSFYVKENGLIRKLQNGLKSKYLRVQFLNRGQYISVHRLVAMAFHPNPNNLPIVNHLDGNGLNNKPENLEWASQSQNVIHGKRGKNTPIPEYKKEIIIAAYKKGFSKLSISNYFKMTDTSVRRIVNASV
jgi:hypothetical protein